MEDVMDGEVLEDHASRRRTARLLRRETRFDAVVDWHEPPPGPLAVALPDGLAGDAGVLRVPDEVEGTITVHRDVPAAALARVLPGMLGRPAALEALTARLGAALRTAHDAVPAAGTPVARTRVERLRDVVAGVPGTGAEGLVDRWRADAGEAHWLALEAGVAAALERPARAWGLGDPAVANVRCAADGTVVVLVDGHAGAVDPAAEVGMLLGELLEMAEVVAVKVPVAREGLVRAAGAFLRGYGALDADATEAVAAVAAARPLLHAADFRRYVAEPGDGSADAARISRYGEHSVKVRGHAAALLHPVG
jgi:hypothetical protein